MNGCVRKLTHEKNAMVRRQAITGALFLVTRHSSLFTALDMKELITTSIQKVEKWVEDHDYKCYEPFDGLSSIFRPLTFGNLLMDRLLLQLIRQSPINLRPLFGVKPLDSTIGRGYMAWGYC